MSRIGTAFDRLLFIELVRISIVSRFFNVFGVQNLDDLLAFCYLESFSH